MELAGSFMTAKESLRFQIISKYMAAKISRLEAARLLNISERTVTRIAKRIQSRGVFGVKNGNWGKRTAIAYPPELRQMVIELYSEKYFDFNVAHFEEVLRRDFKLDISHTTLWRWLKSVKMVKNPRRRVA